MTYWLMKTEPETYSYQDLERAGRDSWDGVRNFTARRHIAAMKPGDLALIYHTGREKAVVGTARIVSEPYPDPNDSRFLWVDVEPVAPLSRAVSLAQIKADPRFSQWELVRLSRLSVMPVPNELWDLLLEQSRDTRS